jgi:hypothetical protein
METKVKIASRYLLPVELLMATLMLSWGTSGWIGGGRLWNVLNQEDLNLQWGLALCGIGLASLSVSLAEWLAGRHWGPGLLLATTKARFWLALISMAVWIYVCYCIFMSRGAVIMVPSLSMQAPVAVMFSAWIAASNLKIAMLLDPKVPTNRLQRQILADRDQLVKGQ